MHVCNIFKGGHDWLERVDKKTVTSPKRGPFDHRTDKQRTITFEIDICAKCGDTRPANYAYFD